MADDTPTNQTDADRSGWYWGVKIIVVLGVIGLAIFDLRTTETVPIVVYATLVGLAGGSELADVIRGRS